MTPTAEQALEALAAIDEWKVAESARVVLRQHIEATAAELANERARGIHTCGPDCTRSGCVNARLREELEALRKDSALVCAYQLPHCKVEVAKQKDGSTLWAVRAFGDCLNKRGEWEYEPLPSSRDAEFIQRCRFATAREAIDAALNQGGK